MKKKFRPITAATEIVYKDEDGAFGDSGRFFTWNDILEIWEDYHEDDILMSKYDSFDEWWADYSQYFPKYELKRID